MDQNRLNVTLGSEIAQSLQPWPQKTVNQHRIGTPPPIPYKQLI
jgi:hypothetical protein